MRRIDPKGDWQKYIKYLPANAKALGTTTLDGNTGALIKLKAGVYHLVMSPFNSVRIPAWRVRAMTGGRKPLVEGKRVCVYLDEATLDKAYAIGRHNVSEGIRKAITLYTGFEDMPKEERVLVEELKRMRQRA